MTSPSQAALIKNDPTCTQSQRPATVTATIPQYLQDTYWWAYLHPRAVHIFERQWLVNAILWGNFARLRNAALREMGEVIEGKVLQVACVYGDFTQQVVQRLAPQAQLDVVDVAPIQIRNLQSKLPPHDHVQVLQQDSSELQFADASFDHVVVFFLLHEQPLSVRRKTIAQALRVTKPGGKLIFVDYHKPKVWSPFRYLMVPVLKLLEPFALDIWKTEIADWLPDGVQYSALAKQTYFGGLYQKVVIRR